MMPMSTRWYFFHLIKYLHSFYHFSKYSISPATSTWSSEIEKSIINSVNEKLRSCWSWIVGASHSDCSTKILESICSFMRNRISGFFFYHSGFESTSLNHESWDDSMEYSSIVEVIFNIFAKIRNSNWCECFIEFEGDISEGSRQLYLFHRFLIRVKWR